MHWQNMGGDGLQSSKEEIKLKNLPSSPSEGARKVNSLKLPL